MGEPLQVGMSFSDANTKWTEALRNTPQKYQGANKSCMCGGIYFSGNDEGTISYTIEYESGAKQTVIAARYRNTSQTSMFEEQLLSEDTYRYYSNEYKLVTPRIAMDGGYQSKCFNYIRNVYYGDNGKMVTEWAVDKNNNGIIDEGEISTKEPNCRLDVEKNINLDA